MAIQGGIATFDTTYDDFLGGFNHVIDKGGELLDTVGKAKDIFGKKTTDLIQQPQMFMAYDDGRNGYASTGYAPQRGQVKNDTIIAQENQNNIIKWLVGIIALIAVVLGIGAAFGDDH